MNEKINDLINHVKFNIKYQQVFFNIPTDIGQLFTYYSCKAHLVDPNKFIEDTLDDFIRYNCKDIKPGDIKEVIPRGHITFIISIPRVLLIKMKRVSRKAKVSLSSILHEALRCSLPYLMDLEQIQKDYWHRLAANEDKKNIMEE